MALETTSLALPDAGNEVPYSRTGVSKHTNQAFYNGRLYVTGGDWKHSAMDGMYSLGLIATDWRRDHPGPTYPSVPAPHALQDGAGFDWWAKKKCFVIWPGSYFAYDPADAPIRDWARGAWYYDPAANTHWQDKALFMLPGSSTGCLYGGVFDEETERLVSFSDSSGGLGVRSWSLATSQRLPDAPLPLFRNKLLPAMYFAQGKPVRIGREVYVIGYRTDGVASHQQPLMFRYNLDTGLVRECTPPPVDGSKIKLIEIRPGTSRGKLIWPFVTGPDGEPHGIGVYTPSKDTWVVDMQVPAYGNFVGNSVCSLPDGRMTLCGSVFGKQMTHLWFLKALEPDVGFN